MRECGNAEMRDRLPDLLGQGPGGELDRVREHVGECDACRDELAFLRRVRGTAVAPRLDAARIAAAIPPYAPAPAWRRMVDSPVGRLAAAAVVLFALAMGQALWKRDAAVRDSLALATVAAPPAELPVGPLSELSESDLESLLDDLDELEAVTPSEEDVVVVPALEGNGA